MEQAQGRASGSEPEPGLVQAQEPEWGLVQVPEPVLEPELAQGRARVPERDPASGSEPVPG